MSHFHREYRDLSDESKMQLMFGEMSITQNHESEAYDYDSTDSFNIPHVEVIHYGSQVWNNMDGKMGVLGPVCKKTKLPPNYRELQYCSCRYWVESEKYVQVNFYLPEE